MNTTTAIFNSFIADDLYQEYDNIKIRFTKLSPNGTVEITQDFIDIENKIGVYLIQNNEYNVFVLSDNQPTLSMGVYDSDTTGDKHLQLYTLSSTGVKAGFSSNVYWYTGKFNETANSTVYAYASYTDSENKTNWINWVLYQDEVGGIVIHNITVNNPSSEYLLYNITSYLDHTIYSFIIFDHPELSEHSVGGIINANEEIQLPIKSVLVAGMLNWIVYIVVALIAVYSTIKSASVVAFVLAGLAALLGMFGLVTISMVVLGLVVFVSFISLLKIGDNEVLAQ